MAQKRNEIILTYLSRTVLDPSRTRLVYRYFRSARALVNFTRGAECARVLSIEEAL